MSYTQLTLQERYVIYHLKLFKLSLREIARRLGRHHSTISRELKRNRPPAARHWVYWHELAHKFALARREQARHHRRRAHAPLVHYVEQGLRSHYSPDVIAARITMEHPSDLQMRVSIETIYRWVYRDAADGGQLYRCLCRAHKKRRRQRRYGSGRGLIPGRVSIHDRPELVGSRERFGDWEGDTVEGAKGTGQITTHVERKSRYLMAERGVEVSHEAIRFWCEKFGRQYARRLRKQRGRLGDRWHLDEVFVRIAGQQRYLWRAVDQKGNVLDILVQKTRDKVAAARFFKKLLRMAKYAPRVVVTDRLASYREPCARLVGSALHIRDKGANNRAENSHQPTRSRERRMRRFKSIAHAQRFLSIFGVINDLFNVGRHHLKSEHRRLLLARRFVAWREATGVAPTAA